MTADTARVLSTEPRLRAGGTLVQPDTTLQPRFARRVWLLIELGVFYVGFPLLIIWAVFVQKVPLFLVLQPILLGIIAYLLWDDTFSVRRELLHHVPLRILGWIALVFVTLGGLIAWATWLQFPDMFLRFPTVSPHVWLFVMLAYPILSVVPQELVYRTFFFHRYGPLFGDARWAAILVNGCLFGFAHIIFFNWIAVFATTIIGILFAYRYETTRAFGAVWLEHSLYGCLIFTVGLGRFFFTGVSNLG